MTATVTIGTRSKHPYGRRNTYIHPYVRHGLGYSTAAWEESLTVKFRDLPSRERRWYTLTLGYGLRDNIGKRQPQPAMTRSHALALMARLQETLLHGGRTIEGIFGALGIAGSCVDVEQYRIGLEYIPVRMGTAIPMGAAARALALLYQQGESLWFFLNKHISGAGHAAPADALGALQANEAFQDSTCSKAPPSVLSHEEGEITLEGSVVVVEEEQRERHQHEGGNRTADESRSSCQGDKLSCTLAELSIALETFSRSVGDEKKAALKGLPTRELRNFLYLGGQGKVTMSELKGLVGTYGRWAFEDARREAREAEAKLADAKRRAAAGKTFSLTDEQLNCAVSFLDPNKDGNIDLKELIHALKEKRIVDAACEKDDQSRDIQSATSTCDVKGSIDGDANGKSSNHSHTTEELFTEGDEAPDKTTSATARVGFGLGDEDHEPQLVIEIANQQTERSEGDGMEGEKEGRTHEVEATLFSLEEADALTVYLVGGDHARPLINVADIQHGVRGAKRTEAQLASREKYRKAGRMFASQMTAAGMALDSDEGWARWFDMCEVGLRAGGATGSRRLIGRSELKRGLKALSVAPGVLYAAIAAADSGCDSESSTTVIGRVGGEELPAWSEREIDDLLSGILVLGDGRGTSVDGGSGMEVSKDVAVELTDCDFREKLMLAISEDRSKAEQNMAVVKSMLPLCERLESHLKERGMRMGQLFDRMVAWTKNASERELARPPFDRKASPVVSAISSSIAMAQRGDESHVPLIALRSILLSLRSGGLTFKERAKVKADERVAVREGEEKKAAQEASEKMSKRRAEADMSGASAVLQLLRASIAAKSIRVIELFNALDTSRDGLISREELREGLRVIAEGSAGRQPSFDQIRERCRKRRKSAVALGKEQGERRGATKMRARIAAAEGSGAAKVLRRIQEHLTRTGLKVMDLFHSISLRGNLELTTAELEMAVGLVDGLDLTRREVRSVFRFLDRDSSGTIDVNEIDEALREFRQLTRDEPSLGAGSMTVVDSCELERLAKRSFADILASRRDGHDDHHTDGNSNIDTREPAQDTVDTGRMVTVNEIAAAFQEALRQYGASDGGSNPIGAMRHPDVHHPSKDTQDAQACVDKVAEWLRSSRTFDRAPTGRVPSLADQMTERQKMELVLQNKLQEKRRRAAGQRHWEKWCKSHRNQPERRGDNQNGIGSGGSSGSNSVGNTGPTLDGVARLRYHHQQQHLQEKEEADTAKRRKEQDAAFAVWAREKDRILRARRREAHRVMASSGRSDGLRMINHELNAGRGALQSNKLPRLDCRSDMVSVGSLAHTAGGNVESPNNAGGRSKFHHHHHRRLCKAERKGLNLAVTRVAVSPYRVRPKEKYEHAKHIVGGDIVARMARGPCAAFPKDLVKEGWQATSQLLGSASMSLIDPTAARRGRRRGKRNGSRARSDDDDDAGNCSTDKNRSSGGESMGRSRRRRTSATQRRSPPSSGSAATVAAGVQHPVAPDSGNGCHDASSHRIQATNREDNIVDSARTIQGTSGTMRSEDHCGGGGVDSGGSRDTSTVGDSPLNARAGASSPSRSALSSYESVNAGHDATCDEQNNNNGNEEGSSSEYARRQERHRPDPTISDGGAGRSGAFSPPSPASAGGARPNGRRGNSRGTPEAGVMGPVERSGDTLGGVFRRSGDGYQLEEGRRRSSAAADMDFPIQSQALPDWADTIKSLPVDDPYEEQDDDFEPDDGDGET